MEIVVDIVMLVLGVVLFIVGLLVIRSLLRKNKSPLPACALLALAVCMIGFSAMTSFKIPGLIEVDKAAELVQHFASAPNDPNAVAAWAKLSRERRAVKPE